MEIQDDYLYSDEHEWADVDDGVARFGITRHAEDLLGDIVYIELPREGESFEAGEEFGVIESVKTASELYAPVGGEVVDVNADLREQPERVNEDPYGEGWMIAVEIDDASETDELMDADEYRDFVDE